MELVSKISMVEISLKAREFLFKFYSVLEVY